MHLARRAAHAPHRGDIDYLSALFVNHVGQSRLNAVERALNRDAHHAVEILLGDVAEHLLLSDSGVVYKHAYSAELPAGEVRHLVHFASRAHIGSEADRPAVFFVYLAAESERRILRSAVVYQHAESVFCKGKSRRTAYAAGSSGYYHIFVSYAHFENPVNCPFEP